jgi:hypothetical protein
MLDPRTMPEGRVDEAIRTAAYLALGEGPQLDHFHTARECVRKAAQGQYSRGTCEHKSSGPRVQIDAHLDRPEQLWRELNLVYDHQSVMVHEIHRVILRRSQGSRIVKEPDDRSRSSGNRQPGQGTLADLAGTIDEHHASVLECFGHQGFRMSGKKVSYGSHLPIVPQKLIRWSLGRTVRGHLDG